MRFEGMNPQPPVTSTRVAAIARRSLVSGSRKPPQPSAQLALDRVERPTLHVPLDPAEVLAHQRQDEALDSQDSQDERRQEDLAWKVAAGNPDDPAPDRRCKRQETRRCADQDPRPLDRLWPEARQDVQREADEPEGRVARPAFTSPVLEVDLDDTGTGRKHERLCELLLADRP